MMRPELAVLGLGGLLLLVHILIAGRYRTRQYGTRWNMGARDEQMPPLNVVAGRLLRAQANYQETFPLAIVAIGGVVMAGKANDLTAFAAWVWLVGRIIYLPLYWSGVPKWRTAVWAVATLALVVIVGVLLLG